MEIDMTSLNNACRQTIAARQRLDSACTIILLDLWTGRFSVRRGLISGRIDVPPHNVSLGVWFNADPDDVLQLAQHVVCSVRATWLG